MAGQPQEPWQSYSPPPADNQDTYAYPQPGTQGFGQAQANVRPAQGYPPPYTVQDQPFPGQAIGDQGAGYQGAQGQEGPPWDAGPGIPAAPIPRTSTDAKGFFAALFDFSFTSFVTPKIIKVLYVLYTLWMILWAVIFLKLGFKYGVSVGIATLVIFDPIFLLLTLGASRVILEFFVITYRIHDELKAIREHADERADERG